MLLPGMAHAQRKLKALKSFNSSATDQVIKEDVGYKVYDFHFPNINKVFRYQNPDLLGQISRQEHRIEQAGRNEAVLKGEVGKLVPLLEAFVSNFGIQNFYYDTKYLWKLAQAYERVGKKDLALSLYRLLLKHHRGDVTKVARYYDSLTVGSREYYVPLKYYYELVEFRKQIDTLRPPQSVLTNMGPGINSTRYPDYAPSLSKNDDSLFYSSRRSGRWMKSSINEDIYFAKSLDGYWFEGMPLASLNTDYNEGSVCISKTGRRIYFSRCNAPDGYGDCDLYVAEWDEKKQDWGKARNLGTGINGKAWESHPSLSVTEDTLYFASNRLGGFGLSDIWYSIRDGKSGNWGPAQNVGPVINTRHNEVSPFMHPKHGVLYFSSDGHLLNFGNVEVVKNIYRPYYENTFYNLDEANNTGQPNAPSTPGRGPRHPEVKKTFDIFKSYLRNGRFQEPKNIGPLINGGGDEYYFAIDSKSNKLYYARSEDTTLNDLDLFSFPLPMEGQPLATTSFRGSLTDTGGNAMAGIVSIIDLDKGIEVSPQALRPDGSFNFDLIKDNNYLLIIQGDEFFRIQELFYLDKDTSIARKAQKISNTKITFSSIEFEENSDEILPTMWEDLDRVRNFLIDNPYFKLRISGHTDRRGDERVNQRLSQARAEAIKRWLVRDALINPARIDALGLGSSKPIVAQEKEEKDRRRNRRVEFEILPPGKRG